MKALSEFKFSTKSTLILMLFAFIFSIGMRLIWLYQNKDHKNFYWNNEIMINTNDGYYYGSGAKKLLDNSVLKYEPRVPKATNNGGGMVACTYLLSKYTPFSLDTIMLYMPIIVSSLVVIPIILIFRLFDQTFIGGLSALYGSIVWSYYNRTMIGYYDSDMFSLTMPIFILYFLIKIVYKKEFSSLVIVSLLFILYMYLYQSARPVSFALALTLFLYMLFFYRKEKFTYQVIILISISLIEFSYPIRVIITLLSAYILYKNIFKQKILIFIAFIISSYYFYSAHVFHAILSKVLSYAKLSNTTLKASSAMTHKSYSLHFFDVQKTIMEASKIPFTIYANRLSGSIYGLFISLIGYILLVTRYKKFILAIPLLGIGFFAWIGGLRFTVYAVPVLAMGGVYFFFFISDKLIQDNLKKYVATIVGTIILIYPNITHIKAYAVTPVFTNETVKVLDNLKKVSDPKSYCISWWDYGYPIWYYANLNTIVDGGKHQNDNFIVSKIFTTTSQIQAVNLAKYSVATYIDSNYKTIANTIFKKYNPNLLLDSFSDPNYVLPKNLKKFQRDIYLFMPYKMLAIYPTIEKFSNLDLISGREYRSSIFFQTQQFQDMGDKIQFFNGLVLDKKNAELIQGQSKEKIATFTIINYDKNMKFNKKQFIIDFTSKLHVIYLQNYHQFLIVDNNVYNSLFFRLFVLEDYDKKLFKQISSTPYAKTYKILK